MSKRLTILDSVVKGEFKAVETYLDSGGDPNIRDKNGAVPLHELLVSGNIKDIFPIARLLIERGADVNAKRSKAAFSSLHMAVNRQLLQIVTLLLEHGADVNGCENKKGYAPIHLPTSPDITSQLIQGGADVNLTDNSGLNSLHHALSAVTSEYSELSMKQRIQLLIDAGVDINQTFPNHTSPLALSIHQYSPEIALLLIEAGAVVNYNSAEQETPLHAAVSRNLEDLVKVLLSKGADPNIESKTDGWTPLFIAVLNGYVNLVKLLIGHGANTLVKDKFGNNLIDLAEKEEVKKLLKNDA